MTSKENKKNNKDNVGSYSLLKNKLKNSKKSFYDFIEDPTRVPVIPSGRWGFDYASGCGGAPQGRSIEFNGIESSGKTTLALILASQAQKMGMHVLFLDYEHAIDPEYVAHLGVSFDPELLTIVKPYCLEEGEAIFNMYMDLERPTLVIQDSLPAMMPELFKTNPEARIKNPGLQSRLQSLFFNAAVKRLSRTNSTIISLNQMRSNMQLGGKVSPFAPKVKASGGHANKHFQSQIYTISKIASEKAQVVDPFTGETIKQVVYYKTLVKNIKNKVGRPHLEAVMYYELGGNFDNMRNLLEAAVNFKIIKKTGAWYSSKHFGDERINGTKKVAALLRENPDIAEKILLELGWLDENGVMDLGRLSRGHIDVKLPSNEDESDLFVDEDDEDDFVDEDD